jgi:hypothetical protein
LHDCSAGWQLLWGDLTAKFYDCGAECHVISRPGAELVQTCDRGAGLDAIRICGGQDRMSVSGVCGYNRRLRGRGGKRNLFCLFTSK